VPKELLHPVIGDKNIGTPVVIVVIEGHAQSFACYCLNPRLAADIAEGPIAIIVVEDARRCAELVRPAVDAKRAPQRMLCAMSQSR
jgi:hypothetical protein